MHKTFNSGQREPCGDLLKDKRTSDKCLAKKKPIKMFISLQMRAGSIPPSLLGRCFSCFSGGENLYLVWLQCFIPLNKRSNFKNLSILGHRTWCSNFLKSLEGMLNEQWILLCSDCACFHQSSALCITLSFTEASPPQCHDL